MMTLPRFGCLRVGLPALAAALAFSLGPRLARADEPAACLSPAPSDWPATSKPYFLIIADSSGSLSANTVLTSNACAYPNDRIGHLRCALRQTIQSFSGEVSFGLMTFPSQLSGCGSTCYTTCSASPLVAGDTSACGSGSGSSRQSGFLRIPVNADWFWQTPPAADNTLNLLQQVDNACADNQELPSFGNGPINGSLRSALSYFNGTYTVPGTGTSIPTPLSGQDLLGSTGACRPVNVVIIADGLDNCDTMADANGAAAALLSGVTVGGRLFSVRTHVIDFADSSDLASFNSLATAGGTAAAYLASDATGLTQALATVVEGSLRAEVADNLDNDCNGCTDEGFPHFGDVQTSPSACCTLARATCMTSYFNSVTPSNPEGTLSLLPCTTPAQAASPAAWLNYSPGDACDGIDNDLDGTIDEGAIMCNGHCPRAEACNGQDDNCDGVIDDGGVCANGCVPSPEVCDGCDNDCDGLIDEGIADVPCGLANPANCVGTRSCAQLANPGGLAGACLPSTGYQACNNSPINEVCGDGIDNDCNGVVDSPCAGSAVPATSSRSLALLAVSLSLMGLAGVAGVRRRRAPVTQQKI